MARVTLTTLPDIPLIQPGDDLTTIILEATRAADIQLVDGDILVIAQKIVSKAEGRIVRLDSIEPSTRAHAYALETDKDPRIVELILRESSEVLRAQPGAMIVRHRLGHVGANAGIDQSNVAREEEDLCLLLPEDPDASARNIRREIHARIGRNVGIVINDSIGRPWRIGNLGLAIGVAGVTALEDRRGDVDMFGRELKITMIPRGDNLAAAASLIMGEAAEGSPVVLIRGFAPEDSTQTSQDLIRPRDKDLFR